MPWNTVSTVIRNFNIYKDYKSLVPQGVRDRYTLDFLKGLFNTENCYECFYAKYERVGDLPLGDSWGSELDKEEQIWGISLLLLQTDKGFELIEKAVSSNPQLQEPSIKSETRNIFLTKLSKGRVLIML